MNISCRIYQALSNWMKRNRRFFGLPLVYASILCTAAFYFLDLTDQNIFLLPTLLIPIGVFMHVYAAKKEGKY